MTDDFDARLDRLQADGRITEQDADEVRRFGDFLKALAKAGLRASDRGPQATARRRAIYLEHYPEEDPDA